MIPPRRLVDGIGPGKLSTPLMAAEPAFVSAVIPGRARDDAANLTDSGSREGSGAAYGRIVCAFSVAVDTIVRSAASRASATRYVPPLIRQPGSDVS